MHKANSSNYKILIQKIHEKQLSLKKFETISLIHSALFYLLSGVYILASTL